MNRDYSNHHLAFRICCIKLEVATIYVVLNLLFSTSVSSFMMNHHTSNNNVVGSIINSRSNVQIVDKRGHLAFKGNQRIKSVIDDNSNQAINEASDSSNYTSMLNDDEEEGSSPQFQLWLDLRQTSISPQAALLHLTNDLWDEYLPPQGKAFLVDKVLVSNIVDEVQRNQIMDDIIDEYENEIEVLFQESDHVVSSYDNSKGETSDDGINMSSIKSGTPVGKIFSIYDGNTGKVNVYSNPLPALEVASSGQWLILESSGIEDKNERNEAIQSLLQLCQGSLAASLKSDEGEDNLNTSGGGIVIDCSSNQDIVEAGALIQSMVGNGQGYSTTDSGILLQSTIPNSNQNQKEMVHYALLIPLDALLWKTASLLVHTDQSLSSL